MTVKLSSVRASFFSHAKQTEAIFPQSYNVIWHSTSSRSNIVKIKLLLRDYTKENSIFGCFLGLLFSGHWNRHHIAKVNEIIRRPYECFDDIIYDLKLIKTLEGGSLDKRIRFIDRQIADERDEYRFAWN